MKKQSDKVVFTASCIIIKKISFTHEVAINKLHTMNFHFIFFDISCCKVTYNK